MVLDTSAIIAIFFDEPERERFVASLYEHQVRLVSAATLLEVQMVFSRTSDETGVAIVAAFLNRFSVQVVPFDHEQSLAAGAAFRRYGKGHHPARLNFGDCMTYALAKTTGEALLFKGEDFGLTDILWA